MNRRELLLLMGSTTIARQAADDDAAMRRIVPIAGEGGRSWPNWVAFADELGQAGYTDGHNIAIDYIFRSVTLSPPALTQAIDAELGRGAEVIIAYGPERTLAAAVAATHTIPIVMVDYDPLAKGYIAGLARPGGNITGVFLQQIEQSAKRLDLFKQAVPDMRRVALLWDRISADQYEAARKAATAVGIAAVSLEFHDTPYDYERALSEAGVGPGDGLLVMTSPIFGVDRERLPRLALDLGLPSMFPERSYVEPGGLMSYGANGVGMARLAARYVDQILKDVKPADLPVEQPTRFELVVNLKTAKAIGVTVTPAILARADEIIE